MAVKEFSLWKRILAAAGAAAFLYSAGCDDAVDNPDATDVSEASDAGVPEFRLPDSGSLVPGPLPPPTVTDCDVNASVVGAGVSIDCMCSKPARGRWSFESDVPDIRTYEGTDRTAYFVSEDTFAPDDAGMKRFSVSCGGPVRDVDFPLDLRQVRYSLECTDGERVEIAVPEYFARSILDSCGRSFSPSLLPSSASDPIYFVENDSVCLRAAYAALPEGGKRICELYNDGETLEDAFVFCDAHGGVRYADARIQSFFEGK